MLPESLPRAASRGYNPMGVGTGIQGISLATPIELPIVETDASDGSAPAPLAAEALGPRDMRNVTTLRISVTDHCNFRCVYCMPEEGMTWLPKADVLTYEEFAEVARIRSIHRLSGSAGGLLPPFSRGDLQIPEVMREAAFALQPGHLSSTLLIDGRYHILKLDRFVDPQQQDFTLAFAERLRHDLSNRKTRQAMQDLERKLFDQADIRVEDPVLSQQFRSKYADN